MPSTTERPFFHRIDSLRGLGAMAVAAYHIAGWTLHDVPLVAKPYQSLFPAHASLMLFFVISGFVLKVALEYGPQSFGRATMKFLLGRAFRILPIVFFSTILVTVVPLCQVGGTPARSLSLESWIENALLLDVTLNSTFWALQVEMLMAPIIVLLYFVEKRFGTRSLQAIAIIATGLAFLPGWAWWPPLSANLFSFVLGMLVPTLGARFARSLSPRRANALSLLLVPLLMLPGPCLGTYSLYSTIFEAYWSFYLVSLISYRSDILPAKCLNAKPLQWLGVAAGSYYVLHPATIVLTMLLTAAIVPAGAPASVGLLVLAAWLLVLVPLARLSYQAIEKPGIALGRRIIRGLEAQVWPGWPMRFRMRTPVNLPERGGGASGGPPHKRRPRRAYAHRSGIPIP